MNPQNNQNYVRDNIFIKKIWYSITKFEKYPEMAAHGVPRALIYLAELLVIFSVILTTIIAINANKVDELGETTENLSYIQKFAKTLNVNFTETQMQELNEAFSEYDISSINTAFTISSAISIFISYYIKTTVDIITLSIFGMITCFFAKIKVKYRAIFNMSTYAMTISILLSLINEVLLVLTDFRIKYFYIMYISIAFICLAAAIFMIKSDLIKQQIELMKVIEEKKKKAYEEESNPKKEDKDEKEDKKEQKKEKKDKQKDDIGSKEEPDLNA